MNQEANKEIKLPEPGTLIVSSSPHLHESSTIPKIMLQVILCLLPVIAASIWFFGWHALRVILLCTVFSMLFEYLWCKLMKTRNTVTDWSAAVTGIILALNLPPLSQWWICAVGAFISIVIAKEVFGGLGQNPFNPAAVGRVALLVGFTGPMTTQWVVPDAATGATPLTLAKTYIGNADKMATLELPGEMCNYFLGNMGGSLGETSAIAILIGAVGLFAFRLIRWEIPLGIICSIFVFTWVVNTGSPATTPGPLFHLLTGSALIGAFFMATDMVTSPLTRSGCLIFGAGIGIITCVIRIWGGFPEGMSFAIVIMNALVPLIDRFCYKRPFGWVHAAGGAR